LKFRVEDFDPGPCLKRSINQRKELLDQRWVNLIIASIAPIPVGWLAAFIVAAFYRWVRRGFNGA
jgi:hypothetical protein